MPAGNRAVAAGLSEVVFHPFVWRFAVRRLVALYPVPVTELDVPKVAHRLRIPARAVRMLVEHGPLDGYRRGRQLFVPVVNLEAYERLVRR